VLLKDDGMKPAKKMQNRTIGVLGGVAEKTRMAVVEEKML